jgi:hypothetical protein
MSLQEVSPEQLAELFHHYHQALAPDFHYSSKSHPEAWEQMPQQERSRLIAAARLALLELASNAAQREDSRRYYAKPGEAEWGC